MIVSQLSIGTTPNPEARIFRVGRRLLPANQYLEATQHTADAAPNHPILASLLSRPYVRRVFIMNDFVTVVKAASAAWQDVEAELSELVESAVEGLPEIEAASATDINLEDPSFAAVFDAYIAPAIAVDGGAIRFRGFDRQSGTVTVDVLGACHGCPSLINTLERGIKPMLLELFPQVVHVTQHRTSE
jgi:NFU1 iron-sulfur cluster scaffold homolog, mitochondrial